MEINKVKRGKSEEELKGWPNNFFDSCVTDEPWSYRFMSRKWDYELPSVALWEEVLRVVKPGAFILVCCGARTQHRSTVNIEDAGFIIRDIITHHFGSGFPKSMNIGDGNGTALKPGVEFWTLAQKPISEKTIAANFKKYGTGALRIDDCRISFKSKSDKESATFGTGIDFKGGNFASKLAFKTKEGNIEANPKGRWPANVVFTHHDNCRLVGTKKISGTFTGNGEAKIGEQSEGVPLRRGKGVDRTDEDGMEEIEDWACVKGCPIKELDQQAPAVGAFAPVQPGERKHGNVYSKFNEQGNNSEDVFYGDSGGASRFYYCAKPDGIEKNKGLEDFYWLRDKDNYVRIKKDEYDILDEKEKAIGNIHNTVKSVDLMRWLVKLITPKGGICIDPFCGSGTTLIGCKMELINWVGIDMVENHCIISEARVAAWNPPKYIEQTLF